MTEKQEPLILVLDDDPSLCGILADILKENNYRPVTFTDPREGLKFLETTRPALIVSDIIMPELDGLSLRKQILEDERLRMTPFIFLTSRDQARDKLEGLMVDADAYLTKPFDPDEFIVTVKHLLRRMSAYQTDMELDPLTKAHNRAYLRQHMESLNRTFAMGSMPFSCVMIDLDHFKEVNDQYGHRTGDLVLASIAEIIQNNVRKDDVLVRYGGEEFFLILPDHKPEAAFIAVERIRKLVGSKVFSDISGEHQFHVTLSSGITSVAPEQTIDQVIEESDRRLYYAKTHGRDQTIAKSVKPR